MARRGCRLRVAGRAEIDHLGGTKAQASLILVFFVFFSGSRASVHGFLRISTGGGRYRPRPTGLAGTFTRIGQISQEST
ncbi:hypothetical protein ASZ90_010509 [hydrocarbon metagenome]|uniref:Uncharacterized protein n=1 Tax=hydrocarbon metagenome TaxID=938273 RepID=A0A0W8FFW8_9ZZZZ